MPFYQKFFDLRKWVYCDGTHIQTDTQTDIAENRLNRHWGQFSENVMIVCISNFKILGKEGASFISNASIVLHLITDSV